MRELWHRAEHFATFGSFETESMPTLGVGSAICDDEALPSFASLLGRRFPSARAHLVDTFECAYLHAMVARFGEDASAIAEVAGVDAEVIGRLLRRHARRGER